MALLRALRTVPGRKIAAKKAAAARWRGKTMAQRRAALAPAIEARKAAAAERRAERHLTELRRSGDLLGPFVPTPGPGRPRADLRAEVDQTRPRAEVGSREEATDADDWEL